MHQAPGGRAAERGGLIVAHHDESGFTLIELMIVVLIIGLLVGIALPTFLGARTRAQNTAAISDLRTGLSASKVYFTDDDSYLGFDAAQAETLEPSLQWADAGDPPTGVVAVAEVTATNIDMVRLSDSGTYFCVTDVSNSPGGVHFGKGPDYASMDTSLECLALPSP
jgi:type IV pilus assembly protein PilA